MAKEVIAADYDNVKATLVKMDREIDEMFSAINSLESAIESTNGWQGIDAIEYKIVLRKYKRKISNSLNWLSSLDKVISRHAHSLYERALKDQQATSFR